MFKKTKKFKELIKQGIKIIFKPKKKDIVLKSEKLTKILNDNTQDLANFSKIISEIIIEEKIKKDRLDKHVKSLRKGLT